METITGKRAAAAILLLAAAAAWISGCAAAGGSGQQFGAKIESADIGAEPSNFRAGPAEELPEMTAREHERMGDGARLRNELAKACLQYEKSLQKNPENPEVMHKKGMVFLAGGLNDRAEETFKKLAEMDPDYAPAFEGLGLALFRKNMPDAAADFFRKAVELDPDLWKSHTYLGMIHASRAEHEAAAEAYREALRAAPGEKAIIYNNLGVSHLKAGNPDKAARVFSHAIDRGLGSERLYNNLGKALGRAGSYDQALAVFLKAGSRAKAYNNLGCLFLEAGDYERAVSSFKKAIAARPDYYKTAGANLEYARHARDGRTVRPYSPVPDGAIIEKNLTPED